MTSVVDLALAIIVPVIFVTTAGITWRPFFQRFQRARWQTKAGVIQVSVLAAAVALGLSRDQIEFDRTIWAISVIALLAYTGSWWLMSHPYGLLGERLTLRLVSFPRAFLAFLDAHASHDGWHLIEIMVVVSLSAAAAAAVLTVTDDTGLSMLAWGGTAAVGFLALASRRHTRKRRNLAKPIPSDSRSH